MPLTVETTEHGYYACYDHPPDEPGETLDMAIRVAVEIAADEARNTGATYYVTSTPAPVAIYVLRCDHPELSKTAMSIMFELAPSGDIIRRPKPTRH
jgi:hypothetical protein